MDRPDHAELALNAIDRCLFDMPEFVQAESIETWVHTELQEEVEAGWITPEDALQMYADWIREFRH